MLPHTYLRGVTILLLAVLFWVGGSPSVLAQDSPSSDNAYVVIGVFAIERNAEKLTKSAKAKGLDYDYQIHPTKDWYYVYRKSSEAYAERERVKEAFPEYYDVWVYEGELGRGVSSLENSKSNGVSNSTRGVEEVASNTSQSNPGDESEMVTITHSVSEANSGKVMNSEVEESADNSSSEFASEEPVTIEPKENTYYLYLNTVNSKNLKEVKGKVNVIDPVRAKQIREAKSHRIVEVRDPNNGSKSVKLATSIFGFREVQQTIHLDNPVNDTTSSYVHTIGDSIIVDFELERYKKGDVLVMYNVYFFKDAAIMKPESIYELNSLLDMLQENDNLVVKLHGHTNGNSHGKIKHLDLDDKNFFSLNANHKEDVGSAKKLSEYRAYTIQHWLMEQGIEEKRIDIKGWGGKKMLFDKLDTQAFKNVRVEVEILEE